MPRARLEPGSTARVDVVVRTRKIGHFFPAGTVDAFDTWLELQARTPTGRVFSGAATWRITAAGPVDPGAHFYRSLNSTLTREPHRQTQRLAVAQRALREA
jgi:hypothetical protein